MNLNYAALLSKAKFTTGPYHWVSQDPSALPPGLRASTGAMLLPQFIQIWHTIEQQTGHRWKNTSYIRNSPSHRRGQAFDLAPDFSPAGEKLYAVSQGSDPVLYKREKLIRQLQTLIHTDFSGGKHIRTGIFIEPDHLHIQALAPEAQTYSGSLPTVIVKWKVAKPIYEDTYARMQLPLIR